MQNETLTGGLSSALGKDKLVKLAVIGATLNLDNDGYTEMISRAANGMDETADFDTSVATLSDTLDDIFNRRAAIYGAGAIVRTVVVPRTHTSLQQEIRRLSTFEGTSLTDLGINYTTEEAANLDAIGATFRSVVSYYNAAATAVGLPQI